MFGADGSIRPVGTKSILLTIFIKIAVIFGMRIAEYCAQIFRIMAGLLEPNLSRNSTRSRILYKSTNFVNADGPDENNGYF